MVVFIHWLQRERVVTVYMQAFSKDPLASNNIRDTGKHPISILIVDGYKIFPIERAFP